MNGQGIGVADESTRSMVLPLLNSPTRPILTWELATRPFTV